MNKKEQQMQRERQEDVVLNKVLWWIVGAVVLEFLLLLLNRFYSYYTPDGIALAQALRTVFTVLGIVLPLCFLALLAWYRSARRSGKGTRLSGALTLIALALAVCAVVIAVFRASGIQFLYIAVPAVAVLALIYYLYQHEFFLIAVLSALGILAVHLVPRADLSALIAYGYAVALAVILAAALFPQAPDQRRHTEAGRQGTSPVPQKRQLRHALCDVYRGGRRTGGCASAGKPAGPVRRDGGLAAHHGGLLHGAPDVTE